jgi:cystathionine beta-lyase/cystathionine gamma-synthase
MTDNTIRYSSYDKSWGFATRAIHVGSSADPTTKAVIPPITLSSTFLLPFPGDEDGFCYSRSNNPTRNGYEQALAGLEGGKWGIAFASGSAAITAATMLLKAGDHVISCNKPFFFNFFFYLFILKKLFSP